jgi:hypothetical protein
MATRKRQPRVRLVREFTNVVGVTYRTYEAADGGRVTVCAKHLLARRPLAKAHTLAMATRRLREMGS